jgi:hypothetical protein
MTQNTAAAAANPTGLGNLIEAYLSILRCFEDPKGETASLGTAGFKDE